MSQSTQRVAEFITRPYRIGFIVNRNIDRQILRNVIAYNTSLWGGYYNIFVPFDGQEIRSDWQRLLVYHDPDIIIFVGETVDTLINEIHDLLLPLAIFTWSDDFVKRITDNKMLRENPIEMRSLFVKYIREDVTNDRVQIPTFSGELFAPYLEFLSGIFFVDSNYTQICEQIGGEAKEYIVSNLEQYLSILDEFLEIVSPIRLTAIELSVSHPSFDALLTNNKIVVTNGVIDDLLIFHSIRASSLRPEQNCIVPIQAFENENAYKIFCNWLGNRLSPNKIEIISYSLDIMTLENFRENLRPHMSNKRIHIHRCNIIPTPPTIYNTKIVESINMDNESIQYFVPQLKFAESLQSTESWIYEIHLSGINIGTQKGFMPSMFRRLNYVLTNPIESDQVVRRNYYARIARGTLSLRGNNRHGYLYFRFPTNSRMIETLCNDSNYEVLVNKSQYLQAMLNLIGEPSQAKFLTDPNIILLFTIRDLIQRKAFTSRDMLRLGEINPANNSTFLEHLHDLAGKQILIRGYNLTCPICGLTAWYNLSQVNEFTICEGCLSEFHIPLNNQFAYRLNLLFSEGQNQGAITVLLTWLLLHRSIRHSLIWQAELSLRKNSEEIEIDLIAMCDGCLVVAECKNKLLPTGMNPNSEKAKVIIQKLIEQIRRNVDFALDINADLYLYSTLDKNVTPKIVEYINTLNDEKSDIEIRIVNRNELEQRKFIDAERPDSNYVFVADLINEATFLPPFYEAENCYSEDPNTKSGEWEIFF